ncbi:7-deoxyloganetic acid glucosyl transferase-like [Apium graveolens]|uniref:7-deoxyloganetic acid glucosyl transferase-like n=1 Tax=Apium graveolens TaxID=4045 RepID=UPI003D7A3F4F
MADPTSIPAHVVIFPFPVQGHMNSMFKLSELLCLAGIHVTYLVTVENHKRLVQNTNGVSWYDKYPGFRFQMLPENISQGDGGQMKLFLNLYESLKTVKPFLMDLLVGKGQTRPVTCLITDGLMKLTLDVGEETGVPVIYFRTASPCSVWTYFCLDKLIESRECPFGGGDDMDLPIKSVPGMEAFLRRRDLPSLFRVPDMGDTSFIRMFCMETEQTVRAQGLILNTFEQLEGPIISQLRTKIPNIYTIGPLHAHLKARLELETTSSTMGFSNSLREEDMSCIKWLEEQPLKSVIYVSFGSLATVTKEQLMEFWYGLVNSGHRFLWVIRIDLLADNSDKKEVPKELEEGTKARGYTVTWAPQEEVLAHPAIGGFLTHSGWNSTLESIYEGVPMICWPYLADQQINSRFVGEVWKLGLDIKDTCDRSSIEKAVRDLMEVRKEEFAKSAKEMATVARKAVNEGGDSHNNLNKLVEGIKMMNVTANRA